MKDKDNAQSVLQLRELVIYLKTNKTMKKMKLKLITNRICSNCGQSMVYTLGILNNSEYR